MKVQKILTFSLVGLSLVLAGCGGGNPSSSGTTSSRQSGGTYDVVMWADEKMHEIFSGEVAKFNEINNGGYTINLTLENCSEADAITNMLNDIESGADLFCFAQDQLARGVMGGALSELGQGATAFVAENNDAGSVAAAKTGGKTYAYPLTSDNGYFMYYDKSVVKAEHIGSLTDIIADCKAAGKNFSMETSTSAWYLASFFFGTGCHSNWTTDANGKFTAVDDDFDSDKGIVACKAMNELQNSGIHVSSSKASDFAAAKPSAVVVSGTWDYEEAKKDLGDNFAAAELPRFTVDGTSYHMGSYNGFKLLGLKPQQDPYKAAALNQLAQYLTGKDCQIERVEKKGWGPSNKEAKNSPAALENQALTALAAQYPYSVPQGQIHGSWWDIAKAIGSDIKDAKTDADYKAALDLYKGKIDDLFKMSPEEQRAFTVIGQLCDTNWDTDFPMTESPANTWKSAALELKAGNEFKCRQGKSWDVAYPSSNFKVEADGTYIIQLVTDKDGGNGVVTLVPAN